MAIRDEHVMGVGVDLVEVERIKRAMARWGSVFISRVFLERESADCCERLRPWVHYAGRFAAKEAVAKALGTGIGVGARLGWHDIEIVANRSEGPPLVRFSQAAERMRQSRGVGRVLVSLSHAREYAVACAVIMGPNHES